MIDLSNKAIIEKIINLLPTMEHYDLLAVFMECRRKSKQKFYDEEGKEL